MGKNTRRERIREITSVFIKHGIKKGLRGAADPANVRMAFEELGPTFVKIGQMLSTRPDLIPPAYTKEFQKLQDNASPEKFEDIRAVLEDSLNGPVDRLFMEFEEPAMASASMAEVHRAKLLSGESVVVKIRRPGVKGKMLSDIAILKLLCRFYGISRVFSFINLKDTLDELEKSAELELDFLNESRNILKFQENNKDIRFVSSPKVYDYYTTETVLVMQYIEGVKIDDVTALDEQGYDRGEIAEKLADNYLKQIFEDGFFHADPHPGNLLVSGGRITYIDFGMMGSLDAMMRDRLNMFLHGLILGDIDAMASAILRIGTRKGPVDDGKLRDNIEEFYEKYAEADFDRLNVSEAVNALFGICVANNIIIPREVTLLGRGLLTIECVLTKISPQINVAKIAANYGMRHFLSSVSLNYNSPESLKKVYKFCAAGLTIPEKLTKFLDMAETGKLNVKIEDTGLGKKNEIANRITNRAVIGLTASAFVIGSSVLAGSGACLLVSKAGFGIAAVLLAWLIVSVIRSGGL